MRERISGAVILIALAVIFVPMLFSEPAPRSERPEPVLTIEQPVEVEREDVPDPEPPATLGQLDDPTSPRDAEGPAEDENVEADVVSTLAESSQSGDEQAASDEEVMVPPEISDPGSAESVDPIAELARAADQRLAERRSQQDESSASAGGQGEASQSSAPSPSVAGGEWAVQVGSFGEPGNAERLESQLREQGFNAYRRPRDNNLTTVYVGPYDSSEAGQRAVSELKSQANLQGLLVRVRD
ncbi:cell division protein [Halomonas urumqiensis]|nr:cell division protein [Halomonas urumqiensis]